MQQTAQNNNQLVNQMVSSNVPNYQDQQKFTQNYFRERKNTEDSTANFQLCFQTIPLGENQNYCNPCQSCVLETETITEILTNYILNISQIQNKNKKLMIIRKVLSIDELGNDEANYMKLYIQNRKEEMMKFQITPLNITYDEQLQEQFILNLYQVFDNFYKGSTSQIVQLANYDFIKPLNSNLVLSLINSTLQIFNERHSEQTKKSVDLKLSYIGIAQQKHSETNWQDCVCTNLQSFSLIFNNNTIIQKQPNKNLLMNNQYFLNLKYQNDQKKITNEIELLYRYFIKEKIKRFKPKIIILLIEIDGETDFEKYFLQKLVMQLEKISQHCLIVIPLLSQQYPLSYQNYMKLTISINNSFIDYSFKRKNKAYYENENMDPQRYEEYSKYFAQTKREEQFYYRQYNALKVLKNEYQSDKNIFENQNKPMYKSYSEDVVQTTCNEDSKFQYNMIGIINSNNQVEMTKLYLENLDQPINISQVKYFLYYNTEQNQFIVCVIKDSKLYFKICYYNGNADNQVPEKICLKQNTYYEKINKKYQGSFILIGTFFYEILVQFSYDTTLQGEVKKYTGFKYFVQIKKYDLQNIKTPETLSNKENRNLTDENILVQFTITELTINQFILLGGTYQSKDFEFLLGSKSILVEIDKDQLKITESTGKLLGYENAFSQKIDKQSLLYFDSQTQYLAAPIQPQIQQITIFGNRQQQMKVIKCGVQNQENFDFYQRKFKLFKSTTQNAKVIRSQNGRQLELIVVVQELTLDNEKIINQENSINLMKLQKQVILNVHKFHFTYDFLKSTINTQYETLKQTLEQVQQQNILRNACLYINWLQDRNNHYIFHLSKPQNLYLLYFVDKPKPKARKFIFEDPKDKDDYLDFDEVILDDQVNEQIWIVRKINYEDHVNLDIFQSDWINLQEVKDSLEDTVTKVSINQVFSIKNIEQDFCLIGLEVKWVLQDGKRKPYLLICTNTKIYEISINIIKELTWENILSYKPNTWEKIPIQFNQSPIYKQRNIQLDINVQIPAIVASFENGDLLICYNDCNVTKEAQKQYLLEIKYLILKDRQRNNNDQIEIEDDEVLPEFQTYTVNYQSNAAINIAKINTISIEKDKFEFSIIVQESDANLYKIFTSEGRRYTKKQLTHMNKSKILTSANPVQSSCLIISQDLESIYQVQ